MKIGLLDLDNYKKINNNEKVFPNLPLMKISAYHKNKGDITEFYDDNNYYDMVYASKVFSFTKDVSNINADTIVRRGTGYCISIDDNNKEIFDSSKDILLPHEIEHILPDYSLYHISDVAYGFTSRGCPRGCDFCHVAKKEGRKSYKVADLSEFWNGQKNIELLDPNTFACKDWKNILEQLIDSKAYVNFNQGVDLRCLNEEKINYLMKVKVKGIHFAFDRFEDWNIIVPRLEQFKSITGWNRSKVTVYVLTNFNTTIEQDILRVEKIKELGFMPYVMRYNKEHIKRGSEINKLARYANNKFFYNIKSFEEYKHLFSEGKLR